MLLTGTDMLPTAEIRILHVHSVVLPKAWGDLSMTLTVQRLLVSFHVAAMTSERKTVLLSRIW